MDTGHRVCFLARLEQFVIRNFGYALVSPVSMDYISIIFTSRFCYINHFIYFTASENLYYI